MSAETHLAQYGITVDQARAFVLANIPTPEVIYNVSLNYGVTAEMLAEIYGGVSADAVVNFFNNQGLNGSALSADDSNDSPPSKDDGLVIDDNDDKITISATDYSGVTNSAAANITDLDEFRADSRFSEIDGSGYTVVVIDTAFDLDHGFLGGDADNNGVSDRIIYHEDFTNEGDGANTSDSSENHGTHVATTIASSDSRYPGVAPGANIIALQVLGADGGAASWIQKALQWVVENGREYNVVAVNMSLGDSSNHTSDYSSWASDELQALANMGIVTVSASGNDYDYLKTEGVSYPSADPNSLSVGALVSSGSSADTFAYFSQRDDDLTDVVAPGYAITAGDVGGGVVSMSGTSMAAPFVSGVVALAQQLANETLGRSLTVDEVLNLIQQSAVVITDSEISSDGVPNTGDNYYRIDVHALGEAILEMDGSTGGGTGGDTGGDTDNGGDSGTPVTPEPDNDIPNNTSTSATLAVGGTETGELESAGDSDWFAISLTSGNSYTFALDGVTLNDPYLRLYDGYGNYLASNDDANGSYNSEMDFVPDSTGTYYLSAGSYQGGGSGTYTLSAVQTSIQDDEPQTGGSTGEYNGTIDYSGDSDWYSVYFTAGNTYNLSLEGAPTSAGTLSDPLLQLYDGNSSFVSGNDDGGTGLNSAMEYTAESSGYYYVVANGYGSSVGSYVLTVDEETTGDGVPDNVSTGYQISDGQQRTGTIDFAGDADWYAIQLNAGTQYTVNLNGAPTSEGTLGDPLLGLYNASGTYVTGNDDGGTGLNASFQYSPDASGTYYISADAYGSHTGTYLLSVESTGSDVGGDTGSASSINSGSSVNGTIDYAYDSDWYSISLTAGIEYTIDLQGAPTGDGTLSDPLLGLYNSSGSFVASNDDGGTGLNSSLVYTAASSGTFYISANAYGTATGSYLLSVEHNGASDAIADNTSTSGSVSAGSAVSGTIDYEYDSDWYAIQMQAGTEYTLSLEGAATSAGTLSDPVMGLYNSAGSYVSGNDDGGTGRNSEMTYTPDYSGTYYVAADGFSSSTGSYTLSVTAAAADVADNTATTASIGMNASLTGTIDTYSDSDWYAISLSAGGQYSFELFGSGFDGLSDPTLRLYDSRGSYVTGDDDGGEGLNSLLEYTASSSGTYYLAADGYGSSTGEYTLSTQELFSGGGDTIQVGSYVSDSLDSSSEQDSFQINLTAGQTYEFNVLGYQSGQGTMLDPYIIVESTSSTNFAVDDDSGSGLESQLQFTATDNGTHIITIGTYDSGSYLLSVDYT